MIALLYFLSRQSMTIPRFQAFSDIKYRKIKTGFADSLENKTLTVTLSSVYTLHHLEEIRMTDFQ